MIRTAKPKPCRVCREPFTPQRMSQKVCGVDCSKEYARQQRELTERKAKREEARADRKRREEQKSIRQVANDAQEKVNEYVRLRDFGDGCISCDRPASWDGQWHASHYRSVGAASGVRFNLWNIHKACSICNHHKSGNIAEYTPRILYKIGPEKLAWLESQNAVKSYSREYLARVKSVFSRKAARQRKRLEKSGYCSKMRHE